jgi:Zn-dependent M28 family amino/carboxypeptidase
MTKSHNGWSLLLVLLSGLLFANTAAAQAASASSVPKSSLIDATRLINDIRTLSADEMEGRSPTRPSMQKARDHVLGRFKDVGLVPMGTSFEQPFEIKARTGTETYKGVNFVGLIKGKKDPAKYIVITAHYDHVGVQRNEIFNGADDNASGTAALFAIARALQKDRPQHSVIIAAFDAEEMGLRGSRYFVQNLPVKKEDILLNINMDMLSRSVKGELWAAGGFSYPQFRPYLEDAKRMAKVKLMLGHDDPKLGRDDWTSQSDHAAFHAAKIPFIYFGVEDHPDYHKPTDDFANIMPDFYVRAVETVLLAVQVLDKGLATGQK